MTDTGGLPSSPTPSTSLSGNWLLPAMKIAHGEITSIESSTISRSTSADSPGGDRDVIAGLAAAISSAARAAGAFAASATTNSLAVPQRKKVVDGLATEAAEEVLRNGDFQILVSAGEGERDDSPGAHSGQRIGNLDVSAQPYDGIFDYVDGTELAATGQPGALSLGAIGRGVRRVPDLQSYAVIGPKTSLTEISLDEPLESNVEATVGTIGEALGRPPDDLIILTHSIESKSHRRNLVERLRDLAKLVIVPSPVAVEPPHLLSLVELSEPAVDALIGNVGLSELSYAAALLDIIAPTYGIKFRISSIDGPRAKPDHPSLAPMFEFSESEIATLASYGLSSEREYRESDLIASNGAIAAALFAVTSNPLLKLTGADESDGCQTSGILVTRDYGITRLKVRY